MPTAETEIQPGDSADNSGCFRETCIFTGTAVLVPQKPSFICSFKDKMVKKCIIHDSSCLKNYIHKALSSILIRKARV